eukprot:maker-scaffold_5-snap-gene-13.7-mRNA-1 protein AED:0.07 eAED:0.07 QI:0/0.66/0.5/1/1/1/4/126/490
MFNFLERFGTSSVNYDDFDFDYLLLNDSDVGDEKEESLDLWFVGVILYATGAFFMALGIALQKTSINREFERTADVALHRPKFKQPIWVSGIVLYGSSGAFMSAALGFAPQSLLTPLMSVVIVSNAILGRFLLYEPISTRDLKCIVVIIISVVMTTLSAPSTDTKPSTEELISLMLTFYFQNWSIHRKIEDHQILSSKDEFLYSFSYGASAGCWGGLSVTMMKSAINILTDNYNNEGLGQTFITPLTYILLSVLVLCWYQQLNWINKGLEKFPAVFVVSIEAVLNEVVAVSGGMLYFQEYKNFNTGQALGFFLGLVIGVVSIVIFAVRDNTVGPEEDFFTNSECMNCCTCCNLIADDIGKRPSVTSINQSIKSTISQGEILYVDETGHEVRLPGNDGLVFYDHISTPTTIIVSGISYLYNSLLGHPEEAAPTPDGTDNSFQRRRESMGRTSFRRQSPPPEEEEGIGARVISYFSDWLVSKDDKSNIEDKL